jgi:hypothetical protein
MSNTKSPLTAKPLRNPGQSLDGQLDDYIDTHLLMPLMLTGISLWLIVVEWLRYFNPKALNPWAVTTVGALVVIASLPWMWFAFKKARRLKLGRDGERAVGQFLERFREDGFQIYHDVLIGDANIDHVLIGPKGVYTVETKTLSKPERGRAVIRASADAVTANDRSLDRNPIIQAKAQANWLKNYFAEAGFKIEVQPVVVFPGWFVEPTDFTALGAWVLEPKALPAFIEGANREIAPDRARALSLCLSNYIRSQANL